MSPDSRWDRYLGMTTAMTQVPVPSMTKPVHPLYQKIDLFTKKSKTVPPIYIKH